MPRFARMVIKGEQAVYHVISRTALEGLPIKDYEKDYLLQLIQQFSRLYFVEVLGFSIMCTHFHLLVKIFPDTDYSDDDIKKRYISFLGEGMEFSNEKIKDFRRKW